MSWNGEDWAMLNPDESVALTAITRPRDLDPALGPDA